LFFGLQNLGLAFFEIIILWLMILALIILYYQVNKTAAYLLIPYILWVSFAAVLNFSIWRLNL
jgi:tryptophan-rich sensory protein